MTRELAVEIPRCPKDGYQLIHGRCPLCDTDVYTVPFEADDPICTRCLASFALEGDTLCGECRADVDTVHAGLPGSEP